jgi:hypothetical protein
MPTPLQIVIGLATVVLVYFQIQKIRVDNRKAAIEIRKLEMEVRKAEAAERADSAVGQNSDADARATRSFLYGMTLGTSSGISDTTQALIIVLYLWAILFMPGGETRTFMMWAAGILTFGAVVELISRYRWRALYRQVSSFAEESGPPTTTEAKPASTAQSQDQHPVEQPRAKQRVDSSAPHGGEAR